MKALLINPADEPECKDLLTKDELAARLGVTHRTVTRLAEERMIPCIRRGRRCLRFSWRAVKRGLRRDDE
jgi:excisionase family DNA binding protein